MMEVSAGGQAQGQEEKQILPENLIWALKEDGSGDEEGWIGMDCDLQRKTKDCSKTETRE